MLTKDIEWNGAVITLRRAKIRDRLLVNSIVGKLGIDTEDVADFAAKRFFARLITQGQVEGDLGYALPAVADSEEDLQAAYEAFLDLDAGLYDSLEQGLYEVDRPLNDPDLLPAEVVPEKKE
jgi:hypothetical protein